MNSVLDQRTIDLVRASIPVLETQGESITLSMYDRLFQDAHIRELFNHGNQGEGGAQVRALATAILAYARHINNLDVIGATIERIAHKHVGYNILPEHYPYVGRALLGALADVLGSAASPELLEAWGKAYWSFADILKAIETTKRDDLAASDGGWSGWRNFVVVEKRAESEVITSFLLAPADGGKVVRHQPGQYLTLRLDRHGQESLKRNYSISSAPNGRTFRISVKREPFGAASRWLHDNVHVGDTVETTPPSGDFFLRDDQERPVVLLSGGVGLTPMIAMLEHISASRTDLQTHFVHGALNGRVHAMGHHVRNLAARHGATAVTTFYSDPENSDQAGRTHDEVGFIDASWLRSNTPLHEADVFLCGPKPFMKAMIGQLLEEGLSPARLHYEIFGPTDELLAA